MFPTTTKYRTYAKPGHGLNLFFDDLPVRDFFSHAYKNQNSWPAANVKETNESFIIELAAPGMEKADFKISLHDETLNITAERKQEAVNENERYTRKEFQYGRFTRAFSLPESVNAEGIAAVYDKGVLLVTLPKKEETAKKENRQIEVG